MKSFRNWQNQTTDYIQSQNSIPTQTQNNTPITSNPNQPTQTDPDVIQAMNRLKNTHNQLRSIFGNLKNKKNTFLYPKFQNSFDREMINGIDSIGRAHAILSPSAKGIQQFN